MRAAQKAYQCLRDGILSGDIPPGSRITEMDAVARSGVSRTPVREAIRRLASEGWVQLQPNAGAMVWEWSAGDIEEIFEIREALEPLVAGRAAERATAEEIDELQALAEEHLAVSQEPGARRLERIEQLNDQFHRLVLAAARMQRAADVLGSLIQVPLVARTLARYRDADLLRSAHHHQELVHAIRSRDAGWASSLMKTHIRAGRVAIVGSINARE